MMLKGELDLFTELKAKNFDVVESRFFIIRNLRDFQLTAGLGLSHCNIEDTANGSNLEKNEGKIHIVVVKILIFIHFYNLFYTKKGKV